MTMLDEADAMERVMRMRGKGGYSQFDWVVSSGVQQRDDYLFEMNQVMKNNGTCTVWTMG